MKDGKRTTISANTRSWEKAEEVAAAIRDSWDPKKIAQAEVEELKQQLENQLAQKQESEMKVESALERWLKALDAELDNDYTVKKYVTAAAKIRLWAKDRNYVRLSQITTDALDEWRTLWKKTADHPHHRMSRTTAGRFLEKVKSFFRYCRRMGWVDTNVAIDVKAIKPDDAETLPLLKGRYEAVLAATFAYDDDMRRDDIYGVELRALIELMRWSGLRISDALMVARHRFYGNLLTLRVRKSQGKLKLTVMVPDHVIAALNSLPKRETVDPNYFFWSGVSKNKSLTGQYQRKLARLNKYLKLIDDEGKPMRFHSHQLRDTFAVEHLLAGTSMQDLSHMLGHKSVRTTEKYYAPWVPERQEQLEKKMTDALRKMGASVSLA